jgi:hypothetical protein
MLGVVIGGSATMIGSLGFRNWLSDGVPAVGLQLAVAWLWCWLWCWLSSR